MSARLGHMAMMFTLATALVLSGTSPALAGAPVTKTVPVLMYHHVGNPPAGAAWPDLWVRTNDLDRELGALEARGWHSISTAQLGTALRTGKAVPPKSFVITFDDGRPDTYTLGFPILRKHGFTATFYIPAGLMGRTKRMTWDQVAELARAGEEIQSHSFSHYDFGRSGTTPAVLVRETKDAGDRIVAELAKRGVTVVVSSFCYPYGHVSAAVKRAVRELGYTFAPTTVMGKVVIGRTNPLLAPRVRVNRSETLAVFLARMGA